jgi:hypothetical protein
MSLVWIFFSGSALGWLQSKEVGQYKKVEDFRWNKFLVLQVFMTISD